MSRLLVAALCVACTANESPDAGADAGATADATSADAAAACSAPDATFGRCVVEGTGADCTGQAGEVSMFVALADGDPMHPVTGPQGAEMFVLALRTSGIDPGDGGANNPFVSIALYDAGEQISTYMATPSFESDGTGTFTAQDLYLALPGPSDPYLGKTLDARGAITDRDGVERCGRISFVATAP